jgi:hypothetical protein
MGMNRWRPILRLGHEFPSQLERIGGFPSGLPPAVLAERDGWQFVAQIFARWENAVDGSYPILYIFLLDGSVETDLIPPYEIGYEGNSVSGLAIVGWRQEAEIFSAAEATLYCHYDPQVDRSTYRVEEYLTWTEKTYRGGIWPYLVYEEDKYGWEFLAKFCLPPEDELLPEGLVEEIVPWEFLNTTVSIFKSSESEIAGVYEW